MNIQTLAPYILAVSLLILVSLATLLYFDMRKRKKEQVLLVGISNNSMAVQFNKIAQNAYNRLLKIPGIRNIILNIRKRVETLAVYDEYRLRTEVMKIVFAIFALTTIIITGLMLIRPALLTAFWVLLGILFLSGVLIDYFVYRVENKMLIQLKEFNNRVRTAYQQTKMVDEAIYDSIQYVGPEMLVQAEHIYNILTHLEPEKELLKYEEVAPTRFLKVIANLSLLVKNQGDKVTDKGSAYLRGLSGLNEELNSETLYRSKLAYQMRSMGPLTLLPMFLALPLKNWTVESFPIVLTFFNSTIGFFTEVVIYAIVLICYLLIRKMKNTTENIHGMNVKEVQWEKALLEKVPLLNKIIVGLTPTPYTKNHFKVQKLLRDANSPLKVEWLTLHRSLITICVLFLLASGFLYAHNRELTSVMNNSMDLLMMSGNPSEDEIELNKKNTDFDKQVIADFKKLSTPPSKEEVEAYIAKRMDLDINNPKVSAAVDRINTKWNVVQNAFFKWWELLISIVVAILASYIPVANLHFKRFLRYKEMDNEVHQLLILISILREFDSMTVHTILEWMERFSIIFREPISITLQDYDSGPEEALDSLNLMVSFEPFQQIIERLKLCVVRISIQEAFEDIDMEREYYMEKRKESQNRALETRKILGDNISLAPLYATVFLYIVIPLVYLAVTKGFEIMSTIG